MIKEGTQKELVYNTLLSHEFMTQSKLVERTKIQPASLSTALTYLRRHGLAEYSGTIGNLRWKKHPIDNPMYPPQPDLVNKKNKKNGKSEQSAIPLIKRVRRVNELISQIKEELHNIYTDRPIYERACILDGEQLYRRKQS